MYKTWVWVDFVLNRQYIENNLCINRFDKIPVCKGSCYLDKQVKKVDKQEQKFPELKVKELALYISETSIFRFQNQVIHQSADNLSLKYENFYVHQETYSIFHPPKPADFLG